MYVMGFNEKKTESPTSFLIWVCANGRISPKMINDMWIFHGGTRCSEQTGHWTWPWRRSRPRIICLDVDDFCNLLHFLHSDLVIFEEWSHPKNVTKMMWVKR